MILIDNPHGNYRFLTGIAPYSAGVIAMPGFEIVRATLQRPIPYGAGFDLIEDYLAALDRPRAALCAVELRLPHALSFDGFSEFNASYQEILTRWDLIIDGRNPVARTNVAPAVAAPETPSLYAFSYTVPAETSATTFVVAGAGDLRDQADLSPAAVVRPGESSPDALREKASTVMGVMQGRLTGLGADWDGVTAVGIYTAQPVDSFLAEVVLQPIGRAAGHGVHWYVSHPPIADLVYEMDLRGVRIELRIL
ncbi:MAG: hypothetical protein KF893_15265 [Caldilineaceae bacterium]|nr:hypothetical protein [Caldilineaceae bacterium]